MSQVKVQVSKDVTVAIREHGKSVGLVKGDRGRFSYDALVSYLSKNRKVARSLAPAVGVTLSGRGGRLSRADAEAIGAIANAIK